MARHVLPAAALALIAASPAWAFQAPAPTAKTGAAPAAQMKTAKPAKAARTAKPMAAAPMAATPRPMAMSAIPHPMKAAPTAAAGRMVTTTTSTGKKITYDCSKAGNATKKACKA